MIRALWNSASGMGAQAAQVDLLAHDLANAGTAGYKKSSAAFADLVYRAVEERGMPVSRPEEPAIGSGVRLAAAEKDFSQGPLVNTGNPLHVAVQGRGFLAVEGPDGGLYLTRDGAFHVNGSGEVVHTSSGYRLLPSISTGGEESRLRIDRYGRVLAGGEEGEGETLLAQIELYLVPNPQGLEAVGNNLFRATPASGEPVAVEPGQGGAGYLLPGYLEVANVEMAEALTKMLLAQRVYSSNSLAARVADEMWSLANNLRR
ncbi:flagellar hook-basal body protein [Thermanaeromonas sp. C210]|uniref:flagellar hook-basal body protein n=1 Tax=Thermanaeromonas sp. C210 TaxID=2731925 RepID=UPI00155CBABB|nr:flagellar hook-basal body protein [Thermanaeromonas sp. C210]GFN24125.1 flagellar basal body protein [Thermanaeromonas sp. C210]